MFKFHISKDGCIYVSPKSRIDNLISELSFFMAVWVCFIVIYQNQMCWCRIYQRIRISSRFQLPLILQRSHSHSHIHME